MSLSRTLLALTAVAALTPQGAAQQAGSVVTAVPRAVLAPVATITRNEAAIRKLPMEKRPNRLGHFYGNTFRRRQAGTWFVNRGRTSRPVAQYFYLAR